MAKEENTENTAQVPGTGAIPPQEGAVDAAVEAAVAEPSRGRAAFIERYRGYHPDMEGDPDDDILFDYAGQGLTERDELRGKYEALNGSNERFAAAISKDPRLAQFVAMIGAGENPMFALGKSFGDIIDQLDDDSLEQLRAGQQEYQARYEHIRENFQNYENTLKGYVEKNQLPEDAATRINNVILDIAEALNEGNIPVEVIDNVWKGMDYDVEKPAEIEAAKLAGRNEAIEDMKGRKAQGSPLPDLAGAKSQPKPRPLPDLADAGTYTPYVDELEVVTTPKRG